MTGLTENHADRLLDKVIRFEDGSRYERLEAMTDFRKDDSEARILYTCRRVPEHPSMINDNSGDLFVMKVKVQYVRVREEEDDITLADVDARESLRVQQGGKMNHSMGQVCNLWRRWRHCRSSGISNARVCHI
nr:hypothetical protein CFP56_71019 [Quercus suber]